MSDALRMTEEMKAQGFEATDDTLSALIDAHLLISDLGTLAKRNAVMLTEGQKKLTTNLT